MQTGKSKGIIPLRPDRKQAETYSVRLVEQAHPFNKNKQQAVIVRMYYTDIYMLFEDGTVFLSYYETQATRSALSHISDFHTSTTGVAVDDIACPEYYQMVLPKTWSNETLVPWDDASDGVWLQVTNKGVFPLAHGYAFGPGRKFCRKDIGQLMHAIRRTAKAMSDFAGTTTADGEAVLPHVRGRAEFRYHFDHIFERVTYLIERYGWQSGQPVPIELLQDMLSVNEQCTVSTRLAWTDDLRLEHKTVANFTLVSSQKKGEENYEKLEKISLGLL